MTIVGLDLSTNCGIAFWPTGHSRPVFSTLRLSGDVEDMGWKCEKLRLNLADIHKNEAITHLFFEAPILPGATQFKTVYTLCGLAVFVEWFGNRIGAKVRQVHQQAYRKHFIGRGTGPSAELKQLAVETCQKMGWMVATDHEAEAIGVLDYGAMCFSIDLPWRDQHLFARPQAARR